MPFLTDVLTADDARAFLAAINEGRVALGKEPIDSVDYEKAIPGMPNGCLSASTLFDQGEGETLSHTFVLPVEAARKLSEGTGWRLDIPVVSFESTEGVVTIPDEIRRMTDPFDRLGNNMSKGSARDPVLKALREAELV